MTGKKALILPCLGRTEADLQDKVAQSVTVEDSMSMVHLSAGKNSPASDYLLSEPAIIAGIAIASLPGTRINWSHLVKHYDRIRDKIEAVLPAFKDFNLRIRQPGGFHLHNSARHRAWRTRTGKAHFVVAPLPRYDIGKGQLRLMTIRSHDQYNTTIYGLNDRYRGVHGERKVILMNEDDMAEQGLLPNDFVDIVGRHTHEAGRVARGFKVTPYNIPRGCAASYFPEANVLVPLDSTADRSHTPTSKFIVVSVQKSRE